MAYSFRQYPLDPPVSHLLVTQPLDVSMVPMGGTSRATSSYLTGLRIQFPDNRDRRCSLNPRFAVSLLAYPEASGLHSMLYNIRACDLLMLRDIDTRT
ncbi:hypothetical protein [uncultured Cyclobacterium sp.]|uniref:hypothetical protein n=1 Tax=uncultured Cyclobacterium sp. TaxID=453820 RepID=UPI0030EBF5F1